MSSFEGELYPYLGANNRYGYADSNGEVVIEPQYPYVDYFYDGVAVVRSPEGKNILIDTHNSEVPLPNTYDELDMLTAADHVFLETTKYYVNRWRFWEWKFLPGFSIIGGGSSDSRLFDTEVAREKRTLYWWNGGRKMTMKRGARGRYEATFSVRGLGEDIVLINDELYQLENNKAKKLAGHVDPYKWVDGGYLMQKISGRYRLLDRHGKPVRKRRFKPMSDLRVNVGGSEFILETQSRWRPGRKRVAVYSANDGKVFIYPDLDKEFPTHIQPYGLQDTITTESILAHAQNIASIPNTDLFIFVLNFGRNVYMMDTSGEWHDPTDHYDDFRVASASGAAIIWPPHGHFLEDPPLPEGWDVKSIGRLGGIDADRLLKVVIGNADERLVGVWDRHASTWLMDPAYHAIATWSEHRRFAAFQHEKDGKWGFFDLANQVIHIPATYDHVLGGGWVRINHPETSQTFFLDVDSKREFRSK